MKSIFQGGAHADTLEETMVILQKEKCIKKFYEKYELENSSWPSFF